MAIRKVRHTDSIIFFKKEWFVQTREKQIIAYRLFVKMMVKPILDLADVPWSDKEIPRAPLSMLLQNKAAGIINK